VLSATPEPVASAAGSNPTGFARWLVVLAAGLVVVSVLGYRVLSRNQAALAESAAANSLPEQPASAPTTQTATVAAESTSAAPAAEIAAQAPAVESAAPAPTAAAEPGSTAAAAAPSAPAAATTATSTAPSESASSDVHRVTIKSKPLKVRFYHFGKLVGVTPFVLELKPGERHAYEAGLPGYGTRKVVIDGSKPEILIGLTREKP